MSAQPVKLVYDGHAHADDRRAQIDLTIAPDGKVTGTIAIQSVCEQNVHLGGADLTFSGVLSGTWESAGRLDRRHLAGNRAFLRHQLAQ